MRSINLVICGVALLTNAVQVRDAHGVTEPFTVSVEREPIKTIEPILRAYVTVGTDKFTFLVPEKFRLTSEVAQEKIQLASLEKDTLITLSFLGPGPAEATELKPGPYRELLSSRYPNGKFVNEFTRPAGGRMGTVFDLDWKSAGGLAQSTRAMYVPTVAGMLEITATSSAKNFPAAQSTLNGVLSSLNFSVNGKLVVQHLSGPL